MRLALAVAAFAAGLSTAALTACEQTLVGPPLCSPRQACAGDARCVLGRCRPDDVELADLGDDRLVFEAADAAWLKDPDAADGHAYLGGDDEAPTLLRFDVRLPQGREVRHAVLVLEPSPGCPVRPGRVSLSLASVRQAWRSEKLPPLPLLGGFATAGDVVVTPPQPVRIDLTELVAAWQAHPHRFHGLALRGAGSSPTGLCVATGQGAGRGPHLDVYLAGSDDGEGGEGGGGGGGGEGGAGGSSADD